MLKNLKSFNPSEIEEKILKFWQENKIFEKSLNKEAKGIMFFMTVRLLPRACRTTAIFWPPQLKI